MAGAVVGDVEGRQILTPLLTSKGHEQHEAALTVHRRIDDAQPAHRVYRTPGRPLPLMVLFTQANGMSVLHETVFENRLVYVPALQRPENQGVRLADSGTTACWRPNRASEARLARAFRHRW